LAEDTPSIHDRSFAVVAAADYAVKTRGRSPFLASWGLGDDSWFGLVCNAPSGSSVTTTSWHYSGSELFDVSGTADNYEYSGTFKVEVFDSTQRLECRKLTLEVSRNTTLGNGSSFDNGPCESWE